jgi:hypothetical protein
MTVDICASFYPFVRSSLITIKDKLHDVLDSDGNKVNI